MSENKRGLPTTVVIDGEQITLTPMWSSIDGESVEIQIVAGINLSEAGVSRLHTVAVDLLVSWRDLWPMIDLETPS